jgi:hypothetical protein
MIKKAGESLTNNEIKLSKSAEAPLPKKASECCMGTSPCSSSKEPSLLHSHATHSQVTETRKGPKTRIVVKFDVGFNNHLFIRGHGANLNWDRGVLLKNIKNDEWVWETDLPFTAGEFKVLINDRQYETGENHRLNCGATIQYTPRF